MRFLILIIKILIIVNIVKSNDSITDIRETELAKYGFNMSKYMNKKFNPCDDFYRYSCGNWHKYHKISNYDDEVSERDVINSIHIQHLHEILSAGETFPIEETFKLAKNYYLSCTETDILGKRDVKPITDFLRRQGGMPFIHTEWKESSFNFTDTIINLKKNFNIDILIGLKFSNDYRKPQNQILYVGETPLSPIPRNYYFETKHKSKIEKYRAMMSKFLQKLGIDYERADALSKKFLAFERDILKGVLVDSTTALKPLTIRQLTREHLLPYDKFVDFHQFIQKILGFTIPDSNEVIEANHHYIKSVLEVIQRTPNRILANYIMYKVAELLMYQNFDNNGKLIKGESRIPYCVRQTMKYFPKITSQLYYDKYKNLAQTSELYLIHGYLKNFLSTYKPTMRSQIQDIKLEFLRYDKRELEENQITGIEITNQDYYKNTENMMKFYANHWAHKYHNTNIDKSDLIKPLDINAYYISIERDNIIKIPVTALQSPFYNSKYPKAINFARLGIYLARALTNVFKNFTHSKYAYEQDFLNNWWKQDDDFGSTNSFGGLVDEKIKCFENQIHYSQLAENIAEDESFAVSFGVKAAFRAYLDYIGKLKANSVRDREILENETLFGLDLTNTQLFFVTYAQNWCKAGRKKDDKLKIYASLANFEEFSNEFRCPEGSWMRPKTICWGW